ncbi:hypothetical protein [Amycolatopsis sp. WGS_07]|uniref:hypothetical protein n=1 Tax=Amycolatopsis sp. WGS_07 TaxID=3076764 RepID=UPI003872DD7A
MASGRGRVRRCPLRGEPVDPPTAGFRRGGWLDALPSRLGKSGIFNTFAEVRWVGEQFLPSEDGELRHQLPLRKAYLEHLAGQNIAETLESLRAWFEEEIPAAGSR